MPLKLFVVSLFFFIFLSKTQVYEVTDKGVVPDEDGVYFVFFMNFTNIINYSPKFLMYIYNETLSKEFNGPYYNYTLVVKHFSTLNFTRLNYTESETVAEDYTEVAPTLLFFANKKCYPYMGSFEYEQLLSYTTEFAKDDWSASSSYIQLSKDNFGYDFSSISLAVLYIYSSTSSGVYNPEKMLPVMHMVALRLAEHKIPVFVTDKSANPEMIAQFGIAQDYDLSLQKSGKLFPFHSSIEIKINDIVLYAKKHNSFGSLLITSAKQGFYEMRKLSNKNQVFMFALCSSNKSVWFRVFWEVMNTKRDELKFLHSFDPKVGQELGCGQEECIRAVYSEHVSSPYDTELLDSLQLNSSKLSDKDDVLNYIEKSRRPLVGIHDARSDAVYRNKYPRVCLYVEVNPQSYEFRETRLFMRRMWEVAILHRNIEFVIGDSEYMEEMLKNRNLGDSCPCLILEESYSKYHHMEKDFYVENLNEFVENLVKTLQIPSGVDGSQLRPFDSDGVRILTDINLNAFITNTKEDRVVLFYKNEYSESKLLQLVYGKAAKKYQSNSTLMFGKFDLRMSKPSTYYDVSKLPIVFFWRANSKTAPIKFQITKKTTFNSFNEFIESKRVEDSGKKAREDL